MCVELPLVGFHKSPDIDGRFAELIRVEDTFEHIYFLSELDKELTRDINKVVVEGSWHGYSCSMCSLTEQQIRNKVVSFPSQLRISVESLLQSWEFPRKNF